MVNWKYDLSAAPCSSRKMLQGNNPYKLITNMDQGQKTSIRKLIHQDLVPPKPYFNVINKE